MKMMMIKYQEVTIEHRDEDEDEEEDKVEGKRSDNENGLQTIECSLLLPALQGVTVRRFPIFYFFSDLLYLLRQGTKHQSVQYDCGWMFYSYSEQYRTVSLLVIQ